MLEVSRAGQVTGYGKVVLVVVVTWSAFGGIFTISPTTMKCWIPSVQTL
jgi:hypothetical protein